MDHSQSSAQGPIAVLERELNLSWAIVAVVVLALAVRLLLEGTASLTETATLLAYVALVVASAFVRVRQWAGIWFLWALFALHFAWLFSSAGLSFGALVLVLIAGVLAVLGVQELRGELER